mmetsp:Transcript_18396/g.26651  ORF Transcript_18396/g.26651 Transcript_18396/m.26651 type:complete len:85 (-) Transcript_18396:35-289(-)
MHIADLTRETTPALTYNGASVSWSPNEMEDERLLSGGVVVMLDIPLDPSLGMGEQGRTGDSKLEPPKDILETSSAAKGDEHSSW